MDNLERKELFTKVDEMITWKLEALRNRIWKETQTIHDDDLEKFIEDLRIAAVFCVDTDTYIQLQAELGSLVNRIQNGRNFDESMRTADIMKKLGIR